MTVFCFIRHGQADSKSNEYGIFKGRGHAMVTLSETVKR